MLPNPLTNLKYKNIKMNLNSMVLVQEIIYLKQMMGHMNMSMNQ